MLACKLPQHNIMITSQPCHPHRRVRPTAALGLGGALLAVALLSATACTDAVTTTSRSTTSSTTTTTASSTTTAAPADVEVSINTSTPVPSTTTAEATEATTEADSNTTTTYELADAAFTNRSKVTTVGIDDVYFGAWHQDAAVEARTTWVELETGTLPNCVVVTPSNGPEGVELWLLQGYVERVDLTNPGIRTRSGYGVGTELTTLMDALGDKLEVEEHTDGSKTATFVPVDEADANYRIVFEIGFDDTVTSYRSGREKYINQTKDTCS